MVVDSTHLLSPPLFRKSPVLCKPFHISSSRILSNCTSPHHITLINPLLRMQLLWVFILWVVYRILQTLRRRRNLPPGPRGGSWTSVLSTLRSGRAHETYALWSELFGKHSVCLDSQRADYVLRDGETGPIISFQILWKHVVIANSLEIVEELFIKRSISFSERPLSSLIPLYVSLQSTSCSIAYLNVPLIVLGANTIARWHSCQRHIQGSDRCAKRWLTYSTPVPCLPAYPQSRFPHASCYPKWQMHREMCMTRSVGA